MASTPLAGMSKSMASGTRAAYSKAALCAAQARTPSKEDQNPATPAPMKASTEKTTAHFSVRVSCLTRRGAGRLLVRGHAPFFNGGAWVAVLTGSSFLRAGSSC
jgi:hypothetical protein